MLHIREYYLFRREAPSDGLDIEQISDAILWRVLETKEQLQTVGHCA